MIAFSEYEEALGRGRLTGAASRSRVVIAAKEQETVILPRELILETGALDLYDDVVKLFRPTYQQNRPAIQCGGWVGYIPLNDKFALEVGTRVPVGNLERLIRVAENYTPNVLRKYARHFAHTNEQPDSLFDILADQLLDVFDGILERGLLKTYEKVLRFGTSPRGRMLPLKSEILSMKSGRPIAASESFERSADFVPNRILALAFEKLALRYRGSSDEIARRRLLRLGKAISRLDGVAYPSMADISPWSIVKTMRSLPPHHESYADALMIARIILLDGGVSVRGKGAAVMLSSVLINMAEVFEEYMRRVLASLLMRDARLMVKNGNKYGDGGAKRTLFDPVAEGIQNPGVTPDIVIEMDGMPALVIDVKYKAAPKIPERPDLNQAILYGARYQSKRVMLLHAGRSQARRQVEFCGNVGEYEVYTGSIDLGAEDIVSEEVAFAHEVGRILA